MSLRTILSNYGFAFQRELFPALEEELGPLGERYELFVTVLGFVQVEQFLTVPAWPAGAPAGGPCGAGTRLHRQGGVRHHNHPGAR